ncbi:TPA: DUF551 domain-containing protein [Enterobacter hormaechei]|uniref:DUF551 domain-containing protein n=1 Tax=Enterobacter hormaechei TaxID=158836 RepID=UPI0007974755|nr:DUF551 domain-containing protein [Enterobacter hormaechei]HCJ6422305.1 DUF551 domain-containing protein [Enterobacter hormaechei subsp. xiangfangensis]MCE1309736.1 DUF551 domain-containing protein [Enterobacter hormaechei]MDV0434006.1 DUF551 domain-containing protein [Enterobacter hormaechei]MEB8179367.1 DUF551 domain-containing protein [Enterobacter hormaechei]SAC26464.1 Protein of uncharacterised function (DUF551) [Enterobacter hormaechei]
MSTLTKEWLLKTIAELEEERDAVPGAVNEDAANALAAMKLSLASLEAEAVAYMIGGHYLMHAQDPKVDNYTSAVPLYTAPPAPVSVPFYFLCMLTGRAKYLRDKGEIKSPELLERAAAMLQGAEPVSNRDELQDGWVACSERLPEDEQEVITHNIFGYRHVYFFDEHSGNFFDRLDGSPVDCVEHVLVSHWMPMPAAPQQEVK